MESSLEKKQRVVLLIDCYERLLTDKQNEYLDLYYEQDLSLSEIALIKDVSRNAVFDNLKKTVNLLESYEEKLQLLKKHQERMKIIDSIDKEESDDHEDLKKHLKMLRDI